MRRAISKSHSNPVWVRAFTCKIWVLKPVRTRRGDRQDRDAHAKTENSKLGRNLHLFRVSIPQRASAAIGWSRPFRPAIRHTLSWALAPEVPMTIPYRGSTGNGTYFITASTFEKKCILQSERMAGLLINVFSHYQQQGKYQLHEFVVMPNHFHILITPLYPVTLEKASN